MLECLDDFCWGISCRDCPLNINSETCESVKFQDKIRAIQTSPTKLSKHDRKELALKKYKEIIEPAYKKYLEIEEPAGKKYLAECQKIDEEEE